MSAPPAGTVKNGGVRFSRPAIQAVKRGLRVARYWKCGRVAAGRSLASRAETIGLRSAGVA